MPTARRVAVCLLWVLGAACDEPPPLSWEVDLVAGLGSDGAADVRENGSLRVRVLVGSCDSGDPVVSATIQGDEERLSSFEKSRLSPGLYCIEARAFDGQCNQVGEGRKVVDLPEAEATHHVVVVEAFSRAAECCSCSCERGTCLRIEEDCTDCLAPPPPTVLRSPWNGVHTGSVHDPASLRPRFTWEQAPGATHYLLRLFRDCDPRTSSCDATVEAMVGADESWSAEGRVHAHRLTSPLEVTQDPEPRPWGSVYHWHVLACTESGCSSPSPSRYLAAGRLRADFDGDGWPELVVGASHMTLEPDLPDEGAAFVLAGARAPLEDFDVLDCDSVPRCRRLRGTPQADADFGLALAALGDVDGDGFSDLAVGAYRHDVPGAANAGVVYLFRGGSDGLRDAPAVILEGPAPQAHSDGGLGNTLAAVGDLDGDGFADVAAGVSEEDRVIVFYGGQATGLSDEALAVIQGPTESRFGAAGALAGPGDVDGDGFADIAAGAGRASLDGAQDAGAAFLIYGSPTRLVPDPPATPDVRLVAEAAADRGFGFELTGGDFDRDGVADIFVGAWPAQTVDLFRGGPQLPRSGRLEGATSSVEMPEIEGFGYGLAIGRAGETPQLFVSATDGSRTSGVTLGSLHVLDSDLAPVRVLMPPDGHPGDGYGYSVAAIDMDVDGQDDLVVGARFLQSAPDAMDRTGKVFVYYGAAPGPVVISTGTVGAELGVSIARDGP